MRWHSLLEQYSFNVLWNWHTQNIREHQILAPIFIYFENIFKKIIQFLEKNRGLSKIVCTFVLDFLFNKPITTA